MAKKIGKHTKNRPWLQPENKHIKHVLRKLKYNSFHIIKGGIHLKDSNESIILW